MSSKVVKRRLQTVNVNVNVNVNVFVNINVNVSLNVDLKVRRGAYGCTHTYRREGRVRGSG